MPPDRPPNQAGGEYRAPTLTPRTTASNTLPAQLSGVVPACAEQCLLTYINQEYSCPQNGFTCLCQHYSSKGFTLGELSYICVHQHCGQASQSEASVLYHICGAQKKAVQPTFSVLTPPPTTSSAFRSSTTTESVPRSTTTTGSVTTSSSRSISDTRPVHSTTRPSSPATRSSATRTSTQSSQDPMSAAASMSNSAQHASKLTGAAIAGIAVAAIVGVALLIAAIVLLICCRRRRRRARSSDDKNDKNEKSYDFIDKTSSVHFRIHPSLKKQTRSHLQPPSNTMPRTDRETINCWQMLAAHPQQRAEQRTEQDIKRSPESVQSYQSARSVTRLLPIPVKPAMPQQMQRPLPTGESVKASQVRTEQAPPAPYFNGYGLPPNPKAMQNLPVRRPEPQELPAAAALPKKPSLAVIPPEKPSLPEIRSPSLSLDIPVSATRTVRLPALSPAGQSQLSATSYTKSPMISPWSLSSPFGFSPLPVVEEEGSLPEHSIRTPLRSLSRDSSVSLLNYYASPEAGVVMPSPLFVDSPQAMELANQKKKAIPAALTINKVVGAPQAVRRDSCASDTSFESTDSDEPTPPDEEDKQLTPVEESPAVQDLPVSPIATIRYPKIPRSANQTVPRSPYRANPPPPQQKSTNGLKPPRAAQTIDRAPPPKHDSLEEWPLKSPTTPDNPATKTPSLSGSTLAAKRRGSSAAQSLELRLDIPGAYSSMKPAALPILKLEDIQPQRYNNDGSKLYAGHYDSPLKGYGRVASGGGQTNPRSQPRSQKASARAREQQQVPKPPPTPGWEPKLTPTKRGDDLYLQVCAATPMSASFMI